MSFEGDTSEGSKNSNSNDGGGGGADADLVYFDESEMRYVFLKIIYVICRLNSGELIRLLSRFFVTQIVF